ncbi:MAG: sugar ABC transporter permease [Clostridia bacterium]|nr:sugar ABC transporter permease [Clostridia bacterium]
MAKFLPFKIKWNKYKNPFKVKLFIFCMLAVPVFCFLVYGVYANLGGLLLSFQNFSRTQEKVIPVGFENYKRFFSLFKRFDYGRMIGVSFGYFAVVMLISIPISITVAFFLYKKIPFGRLIVVVLFLPNIIPMSLLAEYYRQLFDPINGVLNKFLNIILGYTAETAPSYLSDPAYANQMLYIYTVWFGFGYNSILIWGAMSRIPKDLVESAQLDGANLFVEFFRITIPVIWSTLTMVLVLTCMVPFTIYMQSLIIAFNGQAQTTTISLLAIQQLTADPYYSAAISVLIACVSIPTVLIVRKLLDRVFPVVEI